MSVEIIIAHSQYDFKSKVGKIRKNKLAEKLKKILTKEIKWVIIVKRI